MKTFGHFDDQHREYVITDPATPFPWINYLGNEDFFGLISNTAGGYDARDTRSCDRWCFLQSPLRQSRSYAGNSPCR